MKVWYAVKNIAMALAVGVIGTMMVTTNEINSIILVLLGIYFICSGLSSIKETKLGVSIAIVIIGFGIIALGETVLKDNDISYYVSVAAFALIAFRQFAKFFEPCGGKGWQKALTKVLALIYPASIIAAAVMAIFMQKSASASSFFTLGATLWIVHTILVIRFTKNNTGSSGGKSRKSVNSSNSYGADKAKVTAEMKSLANYFTGGFDNLDYGVSIKYSVSVTVSSGKIEFVVSGEIRGADKYMEEAKINSIKNSIESAVDKRRKLILDRAFEVLENIEPDSDYSVNVARGRIST